MVNEPVPMIEFDVQGETYDELDKFALNIARDFFGPSYSPTIAKRGYPRPVQPYIAAGISNLWTVHYQGYGWKKK